MLFFSRARIQVMYKTVTQSQTSVVLKKSTMRLQVCFECDARTLYKVTKLQEAIVYQCASLRGYMRREECIRLELGSVEYRTRTQELRFTHLFEAQVQEHMRSRRWRAPELEAVKLDINTQCRSISVQFRVVRHERVVRDLEQIVKDTCARMKREMKQDISFYRRSKIRACVAQSRGSVIQELLTLDGLRIGSTQLPFKCRPVPSIQVRSGRPRWLTSSVLCKITF